MAAARFATAAGRRLAADRVAFATLFARKLAEEAGEFEAVAPRDLAALSSIAARPRALIELQVDQLLVDSPGAVLVDEEDFARHLSGGRLAVDHSEALSAVAKPFVTFTDFSGWSFERNVT